MAEKSRKVECRPTFGADVTVSPIQVLWAAPWVTSALIPGGGLMMDCARCGAHQEVGVDGCPRELFTLIEQLRVFHLSHARCPGQRDGELALDVVVESASRDPSAAGEDGTPEGGAQQ